MKTKMLARGAVTAAALTLYGGGAEAQVVLRMADSLPAGALQSRYSIQYFMERVTQQVGNAVKFEYFPSEQLGKARDMLKLTQSGVIDAGLIIPALASDKLPFSAVAELPGAFATACQGVTAYWELMTNGILRRVEMEANGLHPLFAVLNPPYQTFSRGKEINTLADYKGLKVRAAGGGQNLLVLKLGGVPISVAAPEMYETLSRGTVDATIFALAGAVAYGIVPLVKHMTVNESFGGLATFYSMSKSGWDKLPETVRKAMAEAGVATNRNACEQLDRDTETNIGLLRDRGVKMTTFTGADRQALDELNKVVAQEWAEGLDKRRQPGSEVLKAFQDALAKKS